MESVIGNDSETVDKIVEEKLDSFVVTSKLNYEMAAGYYWCTVINAGYPTPNPSQVLNISTCPFSGDTTSLKCNGSHIRLSDTPSTNRCANHNVSIDEENVLFGTCDANNDKPSTDIKETAMHGSTSEPLTTTDDSYKTEERTTTDRTLPDLDPDSTMLPSSSSGFPVHFIWIIVGVAFALLIAIIIVMLIVIVYLNHKKNKFKGTAYYMRPVH